MTSDDLTASDLPLTKVLNRFAESGFDASLSALPGGLVQCANCGYESRAADLDVDAQHRLEGASDPSDALLVVGALCRRCERGGALVLGFGPMASELDSDVVSGLPTDRDLIDPVAAET